MAAQDCSIVAADMDSAFPEGFYCTTNFRTEAPGWVEVLVAENDLPRAESVLKEVLNEHEQIDWSKVLEAPTQLEPEPPHPTPTL